MQTTIVMITILISGDALHVQGLEPSDCMTLSLCFGFMFGFDLTWFGLVWFCLAMSSDSSHGVTHDNSGRRRRGNQTCRTEIDLKYLEGTGEEVHGELSSEQVDEEWRHWAGDPVRMMN